MNIGIITSNFPPEKGGVSHTIESLYKSLKKIQDHKVFIFNPFKENKQDLFLFPLRRQDPIEIKYLLKKKLLFLIVYSFYKLIIDKSVKFGDRLNMIFYILSLPGKSLRNFINLSAMYSKLKKCNLDILLSPGTGFNLTLRYIISRLFNLKIVSLSHGNDFLIKYPISFKSVYIKHLDKIILSTRRMLRLFKLIHNIDEEKLEIINRGIILEDYEVNQSKKELREEYNISENTFVLISVGRLVKRKNFSQVIHAINNLIVEKNIKNLKYFIIGNGLEYNNLKALGEQYELGNVVEFLGKCDDSTRNKYLKLADLFIMPSSLNQQSIEGFGIVFIEANYFKLPVIGADSGGIREAIIDGKTGHLVKQNDLNDLTSKILHLYNNRELMKRIGKFGKQRVINKFNWENIVNEYIKIFEETLL